VDFTGWTCRNPNIHAGPNGLTGFSPSRGIRPAYHPVPLIPARFHLLPRFSTSFHLFFSIQGQRDKETLTHRSHRTDLGRSAPVTGRSNSVATPENPFFNPSRLAVDRFGTA